MHSVVFSKRCLAPAERAKPHFEQKKKILANYFLALLRSRNKDLLIHWSIIACMANRLSGSTDRASRNPITKPFSCTFETAISYLNDIYEKTRGARFSYISNLQLCNHASDNYNRRHAHGIQVGPKAGVYHTGMVYSIIIMREFTKPPGTRYIDNEGNIWIVEHSMLTGSWTCVASLRLISRAVPAESRTDAHTHAIESDSHTETITEPAQSENREVAMPDLNYRILSIPGLDCTTASRNPLYQSRLIFSRWCPDSAVIGVNEFADDYVIFVLLLMPENNFVSVVDM